jgi:hypothetical protein
MIHGAEVHVQRLKRLVFSVEDPVCPQKSGIIIGVQDTFLAEKKRKALSLCPSLV